MLVIPPPVPSDTWWMRLLLPPATNRLLPSGEATTPLGSLRSVAEEVHEPDLLPDPAMVVTAPLVCAPTLTTQPSSRSSRSGLPRAPPTRLGALLGVAFIALPGANWQIQRRPAKSTDHVNAARPNCRYSRMMWPLFVFVTYCTSTTRYGCYVVRL